MSTLHVELDVLVKGAECPKYRQPSCHPLNVGDGDIFVCKHRAWPQNRARDFSPVVECGGSFKRCEVVTSKAWRHYKSGLTQRRNNAHKRLNRIENELGFVEHLEGRHHKNRREARKR